VIFYQIRILKTLLFDKEGNLEEIEVSLVSENGIVRRGIKGKEKKIKYNQMANGLNVVGFCNLVGE
jgi:hypothetical protein